MKYKKTKKPFKEYNIYTCSCNRNVEFDRKGIAQHLKEVHSLDTSQPAKQEMIMHLSYGDGYSGSYRLELQGHEFFNSYATAKKSLR